jgi:hypothetical protein
MPDFVDLAHTLDVRFVNFIHLIDGDEAVDTSENLTSYPDLLVPAVVEAKERAKRHSIVLYVAPAYEESTCAQSRAPFRAPRTPAKLPARHLSELFLQFHTRWYAPAGQALSFGPGPAVKTIAPMGMPWRGETCRWLTIRLRWSCSRTRCSRLPMRWR